MHYTATLPTVPPDGLEGTHGNPVISSAAGADNGVGYVGVATDARVVIADMSSAGQTVGWEVAAASFVANSIAGTRVISMSFSTKNHTSSTAPSSFTALFDAIVNAYYQRNILVVASTGNQEFADWYAFPAAWDEVIGVGGSGHSDEFRWNNYAPGNVEIAAPADDVGAICKGGATKEAIDGTSFATPMVAGALMILRERFPGETIGQVRARLQNGAVPMASSLQSGYGRMDLYNSVWWTAPPPAYTAWITGYSSVKPSVPCIWRVETTLPSPTGYEWTVNYMPCGQ